MYTITLLFGDFQGGAPGFQGGEKPPLSPVNATMVNIHVSKYKKYLCHPTQCIILLKYIDTMWHCVIK